MYRSVILSILFLLVSSLPLQAQEANELQGRVLNSSDNPIAEVQILDQATGLLLTETGKGGEFQLSFPDSVERVSLVFLAEGYQSKVMLLRPSSQIYRIILFEAQRSIEGVTISRRRLLPISGYAPLTSRFTTLDILMTPRALGDILGGLMEDPDAQSSDTDGRLSLQGGAPHESQVYIDGLRLPNPYSLSSKNSSVRSILSPSECKEINLLSGGYSASMGQALSGVVQILSRDTKDVKPGSIVSLSSIGPSFTWGLGAPSSATKLELSASYTDLSLYDRVMPSAYHYTRSFYSPSLTASLWHDLPQATLKAQLSYTRMGLGYRPNASMPTFNTRLREDCYYGRLTYVRSLSTACQLEVGAHTQYSDFSGSSLVSPQDQVLDHDLYAEARLALKYSGEPFFILGGLDYSWRDYSETYELTGDRHQLNFTNHLPVSFLEVSYLHRGLSVSAGLRVSMRAPSVRGVSPPVCMQATDLANTSSPPHGGATPSFPRRRSSASRQRSRVADRRSPSSLIAMVIRRPFYSSPSSIRATSTSPALCQWAIPSTSMTKGEGRAMVSHSFIRGALELSLIRPPTPIPRLGLAMIATFDHLPPAM